MVWRGHRRKNEGERAGWLGVGCCHLPLVAKPLALVYQVMYDLSKSTEKGGTKWEHQF